MNIYSIDHQYDDNDDDDNDDDDDSYSYYFAICMSTMRSLTILSSSTSTLGPLFSGRATIDSQVDESRMLPYITRVAL